MRYQVATDTGRPFEVTVAITAGLGFRKIARADSGNGVSDMNPLSQKAVYPIRAVVSAPDQNRGRVPTIGSIGELTIDCRASGIFGRGGSDDPSGCARRDDMIRDVVENHTARTDHHIPADRDACPDRD